MRRKVQKRLEWMDTDDPLLVVGFHEDWLLAASRKGHRGHLRRALIR